MHYTSWTESIDQRISERYRSRPVRPTDPSPIVITSEANGPLMVDSSRVLCNECGNIIRKNYLAHHQGSGACARTVERKRNAQPGANDNIGISSFSQHGPRHVT
jgi:hypothetical protein